MIIYFQILNQLSVESFLVNDWVLTWVGAICGHMLSIKRSGFSGTIPFLKSIVPNKEPQFYARWNFLLLPLIGTILAVFILDPQSISSCFISGVTWHVTLSVLLNTTEKK